MESGQLELTDINDVSLLLEEWAVDDLFLVLDKHALSAIGGDRLLEPVSHNRRVSEFSEFIENPQLEDVCSGVDAICRTKVDAILAIGGGTAIDIAKLIRCFADHDAEPKELIRDQSLITHKNLCPLIAVPTTSGTGSEATHFAVVYIDGVKHSVAHRSVLPDASVVDSSLTHSMPPSLTAVTGLDALCQAIESIWSVNSTRESTLYAVESLKLTIGNLHSAVHAPTPSVRAAMSRAANLSGKAINISKTTAPHACSYAITVNHGVPHGHAAALTLPSFLAFNQHVSDADVNDPRGVDHVRQACNKIVDTLGCRDVHEAQSTLTLLMESIGCETQLSKLGITSDSQIRKIAASVNATRLANNPRLVRDGDIIRILESTRQVRLRLDR